MSDPVESTIRAALEAAGLYYVEENDPRALGLDFYLPVLDVHIEVKQFHSERIGAQMSRVPNVIAIQGMQAARLFAHILAGFPMGAAQDGQGAAASALLPRRRHE